MAKIGLIQVDNRMEYDIKARQEALIELGTACLEEGADLIFFPEEFQYVRNQAVLKEPEHFKALAAEWQRRCADLARRYHAYVVPWDYHIDEEGKIYNMSYILDREGREIGSYRKCNLTYNEQNLGLTPGMEYPVFKLDFGTVGIMICFDNYFPEAAACLANQGAQLVLYPLYGDTLKPQWELKFRTRAADHALHMVSCQIGPHMDIAYTGVADPEGNVLIKLDRAHSWQVVELDVGRMVYSNTAVNPLHGEDLREYLHKSRNYHAFGAVVTEGTKPKDWEEIFCMR